MIGNLPAQEQFINYLKHYTESQKPLFMLLVGPQGIGKSQFLFSFIQDMLGAYAQNDFLWIRDLSQNLGKPHAIQVETPTALKTIPLDEQKSYNNKGIREINTRLQQSPFGKKKVVLIENMQRMTNAAMNAFLKTCEEPLPQRFLFATLEHESGVLPTILSRAMVIRFTLLSDFEMEKILSEKSIDLTAEQKSLIIQLAMGRPGVLDQLIENFKKNPEFLSEIDLLLQLLPQKGQWNRKQQLFKKIDSYGLLENTLLLVIKQQGESGKNDLAEERIKVKKLLGANIALETALRYGILASES